MGCTDSQEVAPPGVGHEKKTAQKPSRLLHLPVFTPLINKLWCPINGEHSDVYTRSFEHLVQADMAARRLLMFGPYCHSHPLIALHVLAYVHVCVCLSHLAEHYGVTEAHMHAQLRSGAHRADGICGQYLAMYERIHRTSESTGATVDVTGGLSVVLWGDSDKSGPSKAADACTVRDIEDENVDTPPTSTPSTAHDSLHYMLLTQSVVREGTVTPSRFHISLVPLRACAFVLARYLCEYWHHLRVPKSHEFCLSCRMYGSRASHKEIIAAFSAPTLRAHTTHYQTNDSRRPHTHARTVQRTSVSHRSWKPDLQEERGLSSNDCEPSSNTPGGSQVSTSSNTQSQVRESTAPERNVGARVYVLMFWYLQGLLRHLGVELKPDAKNKHTPVNGKQQPGEKKNANTGATGGVQTHDDVKNGDEQSQDPGRTSHGRSSDAPTSGNSCAECVSGGKDGCGCQVSRVDRIMEWSDYFNSASAQDGVVTLVEVQRTPDSSVPEANERIEPTRLPTQCSTNDKAAEDHADVSTGQEISVSESQGDNGFADVASVAESEPENAVTTDCGEDSAVNPDGSNEAVKSHRVADPTDGIAEPDLAGEALEPDPSQGAIVETDVGATVLIEPDSSQDAVGECVGVTTSLTVQPDGSRVSEAVRRHDGAVESSRNTVVEPDAPPQDSAAEPDATPHDTAVAADLSSDAAVASNLSLDAGVEPNAFADRTAVEPGSIPDTIEELDPSPDTGDEPDFSRDAGEEPDVSQNIVGASDYPEGEAKMPSGDSREPRDSQDAVKSDKLDGIAPPCTIEPNTSQDAAKRDTTEDTDLLKSAEHPNRLQDVVHAYPSVDTEIDLVPSTMTQDHKCVPLLQAHWDAQRCPLTNRTKPRKEVLPPVNTAWPTILSVCVIQYHLDSQRSMHIPRYSIDTQARLQTHVSPPPDRNQGRVVVSGVRTCEFCLSQLVGFRFSDVMKAMLYVLRPSIAHTLYGIGQDTHTAADSQVSAMMPEENSRALLVWRNLILCDVFHHCDVTGDLAGAIFHAGHGMQIPSRQMRMLSQRQSNSMKATINLLLRMTQRMRGYISTGRMLSLRQAVRLHQYSSELMKVLRSRGVDGLMAVDLCRRILAFL